MAEQTPYSEEVQELYEPAKEPLQEQNYRLELELRKGLVHESSSNNNLNLRIDMAQCVRQRGRHKRSLPRMPIANICTSI